MPRLPTKALAEHLGVRGVQNFVFRDAVNQLEANVARSDIVLYGTDKEDCALSFPVSRAERWVAFVRRRDPGDGGGGVEARRITGYV